MYVSFLTFALPGGLKRVQVPAYGAKPNHVICSVPNRVCLDWMLRSDAASFSEQRGSHDVKIITSQT